jgi:putative endonuclease
MFSTYILYSKTLDKFYVGPSGDSMEERLRKHLSAHKGYTTKAKDWELFHQETFETKSLAYRRELEIKGKKSRKYIEGLKRV